MLKCCTNTKPIGRIAAVFAMQVEPTDPRVIAAIEKELN
jgi:hypothetical protein